jgi:signal transduction histidine kinase
MSRILVVGNYDVVSSKIVDALLESKTPVEYSVGHCDALQRLRTRVFGIVITSPDSSIEEDLAFLEEMRRVRPAVKCIILAPSSTPDEVIAAMRARVFACFTAPFDHLAIANIARTAASDSEWRDHIEVLTARPGWVSVRANCHMLTAERLLTFANELSSLLPRDIRKETIQALREILFNALDHGAAFNAEQVLTITAIQTARSVVFYVRDPGPGFRPDSLGPGQQYVGGYGLLLAKGIVNELIYSDVGNEVLLIKYIA